MYRINQKDNFTNSNTNSKFGVDPLKEQLVNYIFNVVDLSRFKFELLQFDTELHQLVEKKYFLSANFSGSNCLLIFTKIKDTYHSCLIDRKSLSYNRQKVNVNDVITFPINLKLDREIYNGTIFDGIFIQGKKKTFVITDVYFFKGQDYTMSKLDSKLLTTFSYLRSNYNENDKNNNIVLTVNKLYPLAEIESLVENDIPKIKDFFVRGIAFYPEKSGTKLIYLYGNENKDNKDNNAQGQMIAQQKSNDQINNNQNSYNQNSYNQNGYGQNAYNKNNHNKNNYNNQNNNGNQTDNEKTYQKYDNKNAQENQEHKNEEVKVKKSPKLFYLPKNKKDEEYVFQMKTTDMPDVYLLNIVEPVKKEGKTLLKTIKIGIASVQTALKSKWCNDIMKNTNGNILVHCKFNSEKLTWEPIKLSDQKKPSLTEEFEIYEQE